MRGLAGMPDNNSGITGYAIGGMQPLPGSPQHHPFLSYTMTQKLNPDTRIRIAANARQLRQFRPSGRRLDH
jgi:hypothetical protein